MNLQDTYTMIKDIWVKYNILEISLIVTLVLFVLSTLAIGVFFAVIEEDYFLVPHERSRWSVFGVLKNILGAVLICIGVLLLILPGQGVLTILMGLALVDFPQKRKWIHIILAKGPVLKKINAWRARLKKPPLKIPPPHATS